MTKPGHGGLVVSSRNPQLPAEHYSRGWLSALAASVNVLVEYCGMDTDGIDGFLLGCVQGARVENVRVRFQLKCASVATVGKRTKSIGIPFNEWQYNQLRQPPGAHGTIRLVVVLHPHIPPWLELREEELALKVRALHQTLTGAPPVDFSTKATHTVHVPEANVLTPDVIRHWMLEAAGANPVELVDGDAA